MLVRRFLCALFLLLTAVEALRNAGGEKILLSKVQTLTLRHGLKTSHRRVPAVPQLECIGGNARGHYDVDIMRCKNQGSDYEDEDIQWTCTASLPPEFKLGTTDVICEGYDSSSDPYVLKGSCGVEYRLILTDIGEQKYGHKSKSRLYDGNPEDSSGSTLGSILFGIIFVGEGPQMLRAGGQASGPALRLEQPEPIWPVIVDKRNRHRGPEDGAGAALIMVKAAQVEGQDICLRPALPFHPRGIQALGLEVQAGDN
ncbi:MAG: hypothetical protein L6R35_001153 [Caloplaca aegaea]|nr:MAG: hypothetical protein L6R35_001153 [Caloplaca aegaea]